MSRPVNGYAWEDTKAVLKLMNQLLEGFKESDFPPKEGWTLFKKSVDLTYKHWSLRLFRDWDEPEILWADLRHSKDDHTAWVKKVGDQWVNKDIGGS